MVLCDDEKTQSQALERTQPLLPIGLGYGEGVTHDSFRHGTTTLFAAVNVATGAVLTQCRPRHRHQEFLGFLRQIEKSVASYNKSKAPFNWTATANSILEKLQHLCSQISGTTNSLSA